MASTRATLDLYRAERLKNVPVAVFFHGGAYVRGDRNVNAEEKHNHLSMVYQFDTADDARGREIIEFMRRGR